MTCKYLYLSMVRTGRRAIYVPQGSGWCRLAGIDRDLRGGVCDSWALAPLVKTQGSMSRVEPINPRGREVVTMSISQLAGTVGPGAYSAFSGASLTTESAS